MLIAALVALLTAANISPSFARHGYHHGYSRGCAPHYDSAGVADGCL
jgi:hypothetical protein